MHGVSAAPDFETHYLYMFKNDPTRWPPEVFHVLDDQFGDVDAYYGESSLRGPEDLDEQQLLTEAQTAFATLEQLATTDSRST